MQPYDRAIQLCFVHVSSVGPASSSPLGALPPLGGVGGGGKRALAPLKKIPSVKDTPKSPPKKEPPKNAEVDP